jgi:hypothetical protein
VRGGFKRILEEIFIERLGSAFQYGNKIIVEETKMGKEIKCSVLDSENSMVSLPGGVISNHEYFIVRCRSGQAMQPALFGFFITTGFIPKYALTI